MITWQIYTLLAGLTFISFITGLFIDKYNAKAKVCFTAFAMGMFSILAIGANDIARNVVTPLGVLEVAVISGYWESALMWVMYTFSLVSFLMVIVFMFAVAAESNQPAWKKNPVIQNIWGTRR